MSPSALPYNFGLVRTEGSLLGRHHVVVLAYNYEAIHSAMRGLVERCSGATWKEIALKISWIGDWELEDS